MAFEIAPCLENLELTDTWAGFRPHAEDNSPVIGPDEEVAGLFYATGHFRNGILLAPITAKVLADAILNSVASSLFEKFSPARFCGLSA